MNKLRSNSLRRLLDTILNYYSISFGFLTFISILILICFFHINFFEAFFLSYLIINIGIRGLFAFIGNWFSIFSEDVAEKYGWERHNSFQKEIAAADGAFAILGFLSYWFRENFWIATIIGTSVCWILSEYANITSTLRERKNPALKTILNYNVHPLIFLGMHFDLLMAIISLIILIVWKFHIKF